MQNFQFCGALCAQNCDLQRGEKYFPYSCPPIRKTDQALDNIDTVEPRYKEVGYNKTLL